MRRELARIVMAAFTFACLTAFGLAADKSPQRAGGQKWAILVGVDDYAELGKLRFAGNDERALAEQLIAVGFPKKNVLLLHDKAEENKYRPFRANIEKQLDVVLALAERGDLLIVGFSGHGVQLEGKPYLCPLDARLDKLTSTSIALDDVYNRLAKSKATLKLLLVDACRNDLVPAGRRGVALSRGLGEFAGSETRPPEGIMLLTSCGAGQVSMEDDTFGHGVFMHFLLEGLAGKATNHAGIVTLDSLRDYASLETKRYVARTFNENQTPAMRGDMNGTFEFVESLPLHGVTVPDDLPTLQDALRRAANGATITIKPGLYHLDKPLVIGKDVTLQGAGSSPSDTTLECLEGSAVLLNGGRVRMQNLELRNRVNPAPLDALEAKQEALVADGWKKVSAAENEEKRMQSLRELRRTERAIGSTLTERGIYVVDVAGGEVEFVQCNIRSDGGGGIRSTGSAARIEMSHCSLLLAHLGGLTVRDKSQAILRECKAENCGRSCISAENGAVLTMEKCEVRECQSNGISALGSKATLRECDLSGTQKPAIAVAESAEAIAQDCIIHNNLSSGVLALSGSTVTCTGCDIYANVGAGIDALEEGNTVVRKCRIHDGKGAGVLVSTKGMATVFDCDISANAYAGVYIGEHSTAAVTTCRIHEGGEGGIWVRTQAKGVFNDCDVYANTLAGIRIDDGGEPKFAKCKIHDGKAAGCSIAVKGKGEFNECDFFANAYAGMVLAAGADPKVTNCTFSDGRQGGIWVKAKGKGVFTDCDVHRNVLAGFEVEEDADPNVTNCKIHDGKSTGISVHPNGKGTFNGCDVHGHNDTHPEVVVNGDPKLVGCRIHDGKSNGVWIKKQGKGTFVDCDVYGTEDACIKVAGGGNPKLMRCKIHDGKQSGILIAPNGRGEFDACTIERNVLVGILTGGDPKVTNCKIRNEQCGVFVSRNGKGAFMDCDVAVSARLGVLVAEQAAPHFAKCRIHHGKGGGIVIGRKSTGVFAECDLDGNALTGIVVAEDGSPNFARCKVHDGKGAGVFITGKGGSEFSECDFFGNAFPGITIAAGGAPRVVNCTFRDGKQNGIYIKVRGGGVFTGCDIHGNALAGICVDADGDATFADCKIHDGKSHGIMIRSGGKGTYSNNVLSGNTGENWRLGDPVSIVREGNQPNK